MTDEEIVKRAKDAEKRTRFGELVHSPVSNGVNSAYGIGFIEGMVEYRDSLQEEPVSIDFEQELYKHFGRVKDFTLSVAIAKRFYKMGLEHQKPVSDFRERYKHIAKSDYFKKTHEGISVGESMSIEGEESANDDVEKVALQYANKQLTEAGVTDTNCPRELAVSMASLIVNSYKYGAKWQKEMDEIKIVCAHHKTISSKLNDYLCKYYNALYKENGGVLSFARLQNLAIDITEWQIQQMMDGAKAGVVKGDFFINFDDGTSIDLDPAKKMKLAFDVKEREKVKLLLIREE